MFKCFRKTYDYTDRYDRKCTGLSIEDYINIVENDLNSLKELAKDSLDTLYEETPEFKVEFITPSTSMYSVSLDTMFAVKRKTKKPSSPTYFNLYETVKTYKTRKEAEKGLIMIKEELSKN